MGKRNQDLRNTRELKALAAKPQSSLQKDRCDDGLGRYVRWQETVSAIGQAALESTSLNELMKLAASRLADTLQIEFVEILELLPDEQSLILRAGFGFAKELIGHASINAGAKSQAGFTLLAKEPVIVTNLGLERRFSPPALLIDHHIVSGLTVAISGQSRPYGVLGVHSTQVREFTSDDVHFLRTIANVLGAAVRGYQADQAKLDSAARVRAIVNTLVDGIITIDEHGIIESCNPAAEKTFGYTEAELVGRNVNVLMPEPYRNQHDRYLLNYLQTGVKRIIGIGREVVGMRKDGSVFPMDLAVSELAVSEKRMFTGVVRDITERRRMEREVIEAGTNEQRRIGQDLHDGLCQHLAGIAFAAEVLKQKLAKRSAPEAESIGKIGDMIDQAIGQARDLAHGLQPVMLDANGLVSALRALAEKVEEMFHINCQFICDDPCLVDDNNVANHLYRIAQEAISNAVKHGRARTVIVELSVSGDRLSLTIKDDGVGFKGTTLDLDGIGLRTMDYRARAIGGRLTIQAGIRGGTAITCILQGMAVPQSAHPSVIRKGEVGTARNTQIRVLRREPSSIKKRRNK